MPVSRPIAQEMLYYPGVVAKLTILFDGQLTLDPRSAKQRAEEGAVVNLSKIDQPLVLAKGTKDLCEVAGMIPRTGSAQLPGYRTAGTFNIEFAYKDLPIDPRVVRAMAVDIHADAVAAGDFASGMEGRKASGGRLMSVPNPTEDNLLIRGLADGINVDHNDRGSVIQIEGRDLRGMFLDAAIHPDTLKKLDLNKRIDEVVRTLVNDKCPLGSNIQVVVEAGDWPGGKIPSPGVVDDLTRPNKDAGGKKQNATSKGNANDTKFWDLITQWCFLIGAIPYFSGSKLMIRPVKTLYATLKSDQNGADVWDPKNPTPFAGKKSRNISPPISKTSESFGFRRLVYGRDIQSLKYERKLGGIKTPVIECYSTDPDGAEKGADKRVISARYPPEDKKHADANATDVAVGGEGAAKSEVLRIPVPGIRNKSRLEELAKALHSEIGRQEMGGSIETRSLASFGGNNQDPDLLRLRPGDTVEIRQAAGGLQTFPPPVSELNEREGRSFEEDVKAVSKQLGDTPAMRTLARVLVASNQGRIVQLQRTFRVANVNYSWDYSSGISVSFDFTNYVETRFDDEAVQEPALEPIPTEPVLVAIPSGGTRA